MSPAEQLVDIKVISLFALFLLLIIRFISEALPSGITASSKICKYCAVCLASNLQLKENSISGILISLSLSPSFFKSGAFVAMEYKILQISPFLLTIFLVIVEL